MASRGQERHKERMNADPEYADAYREKQRAKKRTPEYRAVKNARRQALLRLDPEYQVREEHRRRMREDPEYREQQRWIKLTPEQQAKEEHHRKLLTDTEYRLAHEEKKRKKRNAYANRYYHEVIKKDPDKTARLHGQMRDRQGEKFFTARDWHFRILNRTKRRYPDVLVGPEEELIQFFGFLGDADDVICGYCQEVILREAVAIDHVIGLAQGGSHTAANLQPIHRSCNARKYHSEEK